MPSSSDPSQPAPLSEPGTEPDSAITLPPPSQQGREAATLPPSDLETVCHRCLHKEPFPPSDSARWRSGGVALGARDRQGRVVPCGVRQSPPTCPVRWRSDGVSTP